MDYAAKAKQHLDTAEQAQAQLAGLFKQALRVAEMDPSTAARQLPPQYAAHRELRDNYWWKQLVDQRDNARAWSTVYAQMAILQRLQETPR